MTTAHVTVHERLSTHAMNATSPRSTRIGLHDEPRIAPCRGPVSSCSTPSAAGALPDADEYGDEGSDTLGNVARAVGGLDLPSLEAIGLGNVEPLEGCPPQPGAPAIAGRLVEPARRARTRRPATGS